MQLIQRKLKKLSLKIQIKFNVTLSILTQILKFLFNMKKTILFKTKINVSQCVASHFSVFSNPLIGSLLDPIIRINARSRLVPINDIKI